MSPQPRWHVAHSWVALTEGAEVAATRAGVSPSHARRKKKDFECLNPGGDDDHGLKDGENHAKAIEMIRAAQHEVLVMVAYIREDWPDLTEAILAAKDRGVDVKLIFDSDTLHTDLLTKLQSADISTRAVPDMHGKIVVVDNRLLMGSFNFTRSSAQFKVETGVFLTSPSLVFDFRSRFYSVWLGRGTQIAGL